MSFTQENTHPSEQLQHDKHRLQQELDYPMALNNLPCDCPYCYRVKCGTVPTYKFADPNGYTKEEMAMRKEKLRSGELADPNCRDLYFVLEKLRNPIAGSDRQIKLLVPTTVFFRDGKPKVMVVSSKRSHNLGSLEYDSSDKIMFSNLRKLFVKSCVEINPFPLSKSNTRAFKATKQRVIVNRNTELSKLRLEESRSQSRTQSPGSSRKFIKKQHGKAHQTSILRKKLLKSTKEAESLNQTMSPTDSLLIAQNEPKSKQVEFRLEDFITRTMLKGFRKLIEKTKVEWIKEFMVIVKKQLEYKVKDEGDFDFSLSDYSKFSDLVVTPTVRKVWFQLDYIQSVVRKGNKDLLFSRCRFDKSHITHPNLFKRASQDAKSAAGFVQNTSPEYVSEEAEIDFMNHLAKENSETYRLYNSYKIHQSILEFTGISLDLFITEFSEDMFGNHYLVNVTLFAMSKGESGLDRHKYRTKPVSLKQELARLESVLQNNNVYRPVVPTWPESLSHLMCSSSVPLQANIQAIKTEADEMVTLMMPKYKKEYIGKFDQLCENEQDELTRQKLREGLAERRNNQRACLSVERRRPEDTHERITNIVIEDMELSDTKVSIRSGRKVVDLGGQSADRWRVSSNARQQNPFKLQGIFKSLNGTPTKHNIKKDLNRTNISNSRETTKTSDKRNLVINKKGYITIELNNATARQYTLGRHNLFRITKPN
jgi:hypothetical protein